MSLRNTKLAEEFIAVLNTADMDRLAVALGEMSNKIKSLGLASKDQNLLMAGSFMSGLMSGLSNETEVLGLLLKYDQAEVGGYTTDMEYMGSAHEYNRLTDTLKEMPSIADRLRDEEIEAFEDMDQEYEPDQEDVPIECWDECNNPN